MRRWHAGMLIDRDRARGLRTEAIVMYRRMDVPGHVELAETLLVQL